VIVVGIDPGTNPALGIIDSVTGRISIFDELSAATRVNGRNTSQPVPELIRFALSESRPDLVLIEHVWMRPTGGANAQGAVSQARLVSSMYLCWGIAVGLGLRVALIPPATWKKHFRLHGTDKEDSRLKCLSLMPTAAGFLMRKMDHNRAEALLLARFGLDTYQENVTA
jgi:hypothetical protein